MRVINMKSVKQQARRLWRLWRLRGCAVLLFGWLCCALAAGAAVLVGLRGRVLPAAALCLPVVSTAACLQTLETAVLFRRAAAMFWPRRQVVRSVLRSLLLPGVRLGLLGFAGLPALALGGLCVLLRQTVPAGVTVRLALCALLAAAAALGFFLRWNRLLFAVPALLLCGASLPFALRASVRIMRANRRRFSALRRSFLPACFGCLCLLPAPFVHLYYRQCALLLLLQPPDET